MNALHVVILAAGKGTRMRSERAKVLHPLAGRPLAQHVIDAARRLRPAGIVLVYGHGGDAVPAALAAPGIQFVKQEPQLGTGHAVRQALPKLPRGGVTLVLYGDVPLVRPETLRRLAGRSAEKRLTLLTAELPEPAGYGRIVRGERGAVERIVEHKDADAKTRAIREINTGILCAPTERLRGWLARLRNDNAQREYYLTDIVALAVADGFPVHAVRAADPAEVLGVNGKAQLADLERRVQRSIADRLLESGVTLADPARLDVRGRLACGRDVFIDVGCVFEGDVKLGDGVRVGPYCVVRESRIGPGTEIAAYSLLDSADVGRDCRIGPYARLRPGAKLAAAVHVGNFVEVKNSRIGRGSKANHLSYVGDTEVGREVNIGAGTITCNYDGVNKHRTVIADGAFIGSDTQLVAPVKVGRNATLGAGTTLTRDAPPGKLTLTRAAQITVDTWQRPVKKK
jgi:bifunctional UDP-N-acetylglucosamine pyrophosphorylase/glucosamine-1-phosphate N-acetyltransferase